MCSGAISAAVTVATDEISADWSSVVLTKLYLHLRCPLVGW